jgi:hypothetical protein
VIYGYAGQVDGLVGRIREELGEEALGRSFCFAKKRS